MRRARDADAGASALSLRDTLGVAIKRFLYEGCGRDRWQQPDRVIKALGLEPGVVIADVGSGSGYFTLRFARSVGPTGRVLAVDTDRQLLEAIGRNAREQGLSNVATVESSDSTIALPQPVDVIFLSNVFHHLPEQRHYFASARSQLAPGGRVAIIESRPEGWFARWFGHSTEPATIRGTMGEAGFNLVASHDFVERHSFQIFEPTTDPGTARAD